MSGLLALKETKRCSIRRIARVHSALPKIVSALSKSTQHCQTYSALSKSTQHCHTYSALPNLLSIAKVYSALPNSLSIAKDRLKTRQGQHPYLRFDNAEPGPVSVHCEGGPRVASIERQDEG